MLHNIFGLVQFGFFLNLTIRLMNKVKTPKTQQQQKQEQKSLHLFLVVKVH